MSRARSQRVKSATQSQLLRVWSVVHAAPSSGSGWAATPAASRHEVTGPAVWAGPPTACLGPFRGSPPSDRQGVAAPLRWRHMPAAQPELRRLVDPKEAT